MSLISHLVSRYAPSAENAASEALGYVLDRSPVAAEAMVRMLSSVTPGLPKVLHWRTQADRGDNVFPDVEGVALDGTAPALIEAKFWAGLTESQPLGYLKRFAATRPGILAFVAPAKRFQTLWPEILGRCDAAGLVGDEKTTERASEFWHLTLKSGHQLALLSWRAVLDEIQSGLTQAGELRHANDLEQIRDLCALMDSTAFQPFSLEELSSQTVPRRIRQLQELGMEIATRAQAEGIGAAKDRNGKPLTTGQTTTYNGRYMRVGGADTFVGFEIVRWAELGVTPFWVRFYGADEAGVKLAKERLEARRYETPPGYFEVEGEPYIPLRVPAGREKGAVIQAALAQLRDLKTQLSTISPA